MRYPRRTPLTRYMQWSTTCESTSPFTRLRHTDKQDFAPSPLALLPSVVSALTAHGFMGNPHKPRFEIMIDGGVRRATDVLKAVALGATAVGIGRPMIYAMSTYGEDGISKLLEILKDEFEMNMRLIGARNIAEVVPSMVDTSALNHAGGSVTMYEENCESDSCTASGVWGEGGACVEAFKLADLWHAKEGPVSSEGKIPFELGRALLFRDSRLQRPSKAIRDAANDRRAHVARGRQGEAVGSCTLDLSCISVFFRRPLATGASREDAATGCRPVSLSCRPEIRPVGGTVVHPSPLGFEYHESSATAPVDRLVLLVAFGPTDSL